MSLIKKYGKMGGEKMSTLYECLKGYFYGSNFSEMKKSLDKARSVGESKGMDIGKKEEKLNIAKNMLNKNYNVKDIMNITGLNEDDIYKLRDK